MKQKHFIKAVFFFQLLSISAWGQAVFAPKVGAEWHYWISTDPYTYPNYPQLGIPKNGNLTVSYTKDTLISGRNMKKFEQKEIYKFKENDSLYSRYKESFYMIQSNDSIFILAQDTLALSFVYTNQIGMVTEIGTIAPNSSHFFNLMLQSISDTTAINNSNVRLKKYIYKLTPVGILFDVYYTNPLIVLDRIGAINADITVLNSQGQGDNNANYYRLICYKDSEVGELKFSNSDCNGLVSVSDLKASPRDFYIDNQNDGIHIFLKNDNNEFVKNVKVYDIIGRLVWIVTNTEKKEEIIISKNNLPQGVLIVTLEGNGFVYNAKKVIINN